MTTLTAQQAYETMLDFLEGYYERTGSDDLGGLLGGFQFMEDGGTMDPAAWADWQESVVKILTASTKEA